MYKLAVIVGSLRKDSINKKLARSLAALGTDLFDFVFVDISQVPPFNQDDENALPKAVADMKAAVASADAVLFVTPEYNRSIPGVLKNALDWGSRPYGSNVWAGKAAAMAGSSPGNVGTAVAQSHLRSVLGFLGMKLTVQPELYFKDAPGLLGEDGTVKDADSGRFLRGFLEAFAAWVAKAA
ncbi:NAD(P)H-dependent oxidoreductase [Desulfovibrio sp. OttesenSCG-928-G11]|nr:NAD(P)H-dependent oxidoreductase [Desulfovibrio sp. OttesenSCG-928-G11]